MGNCFSNQYNNNNNDDDQSTEPTTHITPVHTNTHTYVNTLNNTNTSNTFLSSSRTAINDNQLLLKSIHTVISSFRAFDIRKITIGEIWNISKHYLNDFTLCNYIIYYFRHKTHRTENFLKKPFLIKTSKK